MSVAPMRIVIAVLALLMGAVPVVAAEPTGFWRIDGMRVVDSGGASVRLRGVNLGNWLLWESWMFGGGLRGAESVMLGRIAEALGADAARDVHRRVQGAYITEHDVALIAQAGFNTIRVPVNWRTLVRDADCLACDNEGWARLDRLIGWARDRGLRVIIDMHAAPGGQSGLLIADPPDGKAALWQDERHRQRLVALWREIAQRYAAEPAVAGYDLLNEPMAPTGAALLTLYRQLIEAIRTVDRRHIIWLEGNRLAQDMSVFSAPMGENIGYSQHIYTFLGDQRQRQLGDAAATARRLRAPVWIGEFGQASSDMVRSTVAMIEATEGAVGWSYWTWKRAASATPTLCALDLPQAWRAVVPWVSNNVIARKPKPADLSSGIAALTQYLDGYRCMPDTRMVSALTGRRLSP